VDRRGIKRALWALIVVLALCAPATASAAGEEETGGFGAFRLDGTHGYEVLVLANSRPYFKHGEVLVLVTGRTSAVVYFAPARVTTTEIEADLGPVGQISVAFQPEGEPERIRSNCTEGDSGDVQPGSWAGTVDLTGEEGFTHAEGIRLKSIVSPFIDLACGSVIRISEPTGQGLPGARLVARSAAKKDSRFLQVNQNRPSGPVRVEASVEERRHGLVVSREVVHRYPGNAFAFDPELRSAALDMPSPFSGRATFNRNAKPRNQWTGNLLLDFPGRANVPMTGGRFKVALWHAKRTEESRGERSRPLSTLFGYAEQTRHDRLGHR
jgi:hypothetical protein